MCTNYNNVNLRNGPGVKFPLAFKLMQKDYPLLILESFENWYAVTDFNGDKFWVSSANLTRKCGGIVKLNVSPPVKIKPNKNSVTLFTLQEGFVIKNIKCYEKWCNIKIEDKSGWVEKQFIWGV
jgi:SH3-like domain-containing protein